MCSDSESFSNGNGNGGPAHGDSMGNGASPATVTIDGTRLGAGDTHWAQQV